MPAKNGVPEVAEKEFGKLIENPVVLVDFFAEWCMPCLMMAPIIEEISDKFDKIKFAKVNVDDNQGLAQKFNVMSIPTLIIFKDGKEAERITGALPVEAIEEKLEKYVK